MVFPSTFGLLFPFLQLLITINRDWSPLHRAVWNGDINKVMSLADQCSVKTKDSLGWTPLHLACSDSESSAFTFRQIFPRELEQRLLHPNSDKCFPRRRDSQENALAMCRVLIDAGAEVNAETSLQWLPMHNVASSGWVDLAHLLLENGGSAFSSRICSPYCWVEQDREKYYARSSEAMKELLRAHLSDEQMEQIKALHERNFS
jgi:ankyrin repeat protein